LDFLIEEKLTNPDVLSKLIEHAGFAIFKVRRLSRDEPP